MWSTRLVPGSAPDGSFLLSVLAKRTYRFSPGEMAIPNGLEQIPFLEKDLFLDPGDPVTCPELEETDLVAFKPNVDVVFHGSAWAPRGKRGYFFDLSVAVGALTHTLRAFGNRQVRPKMFGLDFTDPEPFESMPLHWGLAYGGTDFLTRPDMPLTYPRNPVGKGFAVAPPVERLHEIALPNLEDPEDLLNPSRLLIKHFENWPKAPVPAALGWTCRRAHPRLLMAGVDARDLSSQQVSRQRSLQAKDEVGTPGADAPAEAPRLLNHQFHNGAPSFLQFPGLRGNEMVTMVHMDPDHPKFEFLLPDDPPIIFLDTGEGRRELPAVLQTVQLYKPANQLTMLWRGSLRGAGIEWFSGLSCLDHGAASSKD